MVGSSEFKYLIVVFINQLDILYIFILFSDKRSPFIIPVLNHKKDSVFNVFNGYFNVDMLTLCISAMNHARKLKFSSF